jgi:hypothetical protein
MVVKRQQETFAPVTVGGDLKTQVPQRPAFLLVEFKSSYDTHSSWYIMVSVSLV